MDIKNKLEKISLYTKLIDDYKKEVEEIFMKTCNKIIRHIHNIKLYLDSYPNNLTYYDWYIDDRYIIVEWEEFCYGNLDKGYFSFPMNVLYDENTLFLYLDSLTLEKQKLDMQEKEKQELEKTKRIERLKEELSKLEINKLKILEAKELKEKNVPSVRNNKNIG